MLGVLSMRGQRASGPGRSYPGAQVLTREAILRVFGVRNKPPRTPVSLAGEDSNMCDRTISGRPKARGMYSTIQNEERWKRGVVL